MTRNPAAPSGSNVQEIAVTEADALACVDRAVSPRGAYIVDQAFRLHARNVGRGAPPRTDLILRRLRQLESKGLLICVGGPDGYYGYEWRITDAGRLALRQQESRTS